MAADGHCPIGRDTDDAGNRREGHLRREHHDQSLEKQGEARKLAGEWRFDEMNRPIGQLHARGPHFEHTFVLEEVEMPIGLDHRIMHRMRAADPFHGEAGPCGEVDLHRQDLAGFHELDPGDAPRRRNAQCRLEQLVVHGQCPLLIMADAAECRIGQTNSVRAG